jgi:hypothetical protein
MMTVRVRRIRTQPDKDRIGHQITPKCISENELPMTRWLGRKRELAITMSEELLRTRVRQKPIAKTEPHS